MVQCLKLHKIFSYNAKTLRHTHFVKITDFDTLYFSVVSLLKTVMATNRYCVELAKRGTAGCKECNVKIDKGCVRIAKIIPNPFTESGGEMKQWFHVRCAFQKLSRARATTKKIESTDDLEGWDDLEEDRRDEVLKCLSEFSPNSSQKKTPQKKSPKGAVKEESQPEASTSENNSVGSSRDDSFREFRKLCNKVSEENRHLEKTAIMKKFFLKGSGGDGFKGDLCLWIKLLLPTVEKRVYNLQSKQLVKLFSEIFYADAEEMLEDLEQGDVARTIGTFFENSSSFPPCSKSTLTLQEVDKYLDELTTYSKEAEQTFILKKIAKRCTANDLQIFIRLIKHDLRINAGAKPILDAIHPTAYEAFQSSRNLKNIVNDVLKNKGGGALTVQASLMTPVLPMLAMACKSVTQAFDKCPNGFFVEIKYDGERVQVHKKGSEFSYFSRSLKPVMAHKISHFKDYIPKAFPHGNSLIIDSEILLVSKEGLPLPFGTLGAHRKAAFKDATVCLYVFDILQFNEDNLMKTPLFKRREILMKNMTEVKNHVMFSEMKETNDPKELRDIINSVIKQGLEGLVIKDKKSVYEPGKRHWLKVKKDYLKGEDLEKDTIPDTADLVVLGAYYGTGKYGGMKSIFLMGCLDEYSGKWCTVTKVRGFTDDELSELQDTPKMTKISKNPDLVPSFMKIKKALVPDFIIEDIEKAPVWEVIGTEFSKADAHTANGISIRFPRVKCVRDDKTWKQGTTLKELQHLYDLSKETTERVGLEVIKSVKDEDEDEDDLNSSRTSDDSPKKKSVPSTSKSVKRSSDESLSPPKKIKSESIDESSASKSGNSILVNVFTGDKLYIPSSVKDADKLRRYFVAYDGTLLKKSEADEATIVIVSNEADEVQTTAEKVTVDWLWASIKLKKRMPTKLYEPT